MLLGAGMKGAADIRGLEERSITHVLKLSNYEQNPTIFREDKFQYLIINIPVRTLLLLQYSRA